MYFTIEEIKKFDFDGKSICFRSKDKKFDKIIENLNPVDFRDVSSRLVSFWKENKRPIALKYLTRICNDNKIERLNIRSISVNGGNQLIFPEENNPKLYYLLGLILGDGCLCYKNKFQNGGSYRLQITVRYKKEVHQIRNLIKDLFNIDSSFYKDKGCYNVCTFSKVLVIFLNKIYDIPIGKKHKHMKVPIAVKKDKVYIKYFLKGLFDSDGNIYKHRNSECLQIRQKSKSFIEEIQLLLKIVGIEIGGPYYDKANGSTLLWSSKKETLDRFKNEINVIMFEPL